MATNTNLGGVFTTDINNLSSPNTFVSTENVVGLIFDTKIVGGFAAAFETGSVAATTFKDGNVVELNNAKDVETAGIDDKVLAGVAKYHLDSFFTLAGPNQRIFVSFMDSSSDTNFDAIEKMQLAANGIIYQIGVWTGEAIGKTETKTEDGKTVTTINAAGADSLCAKLEKAAELLGGKVGVTNYEGNAPLNILLSAPIVNDATIDIKNLPDLSGMNFPKVSVLLGQESTEAAHKIMYAVNTKATGSTYNAPLGCIGAALGCLAVAPANESIAHVGSFNLAALIQSAELGFGDIKKGTGADVDNYEATSSFNNIKALGYTKRNQYLHKKGYIFLTNYDGLENSIFFSSDQTLSTEDYRTISRCRVMHKSRRVVRRALLPMVNGAVEVDVATGNLSSATITVFQNLVLNALDKNMVEPTSGNPQISGRNCTIDSKQDVLGNDELKIDYRIVPHGVSSAISVTEGFTSTSKK